MKLSYSRLTTFLSCPKKYFYNYVEGLEGKPNEHLLLGQLFHELLEKYYKDEDYAEVITRYKNMVNTGKLEHPIDLFEHVLMEYTNHYKKQDEKEKTIGIELKLIEEWDTEFKDEVTGIIDKIVEIDEITKIRDYKTTIGNLKYKDESVRYNPQQLLYLALAEHNMHIDIDAIEIDEIRLRKLQPVPINKNGKPSTAMNRLGLVTHDAYYNKLCELGLEDKPEYMGVLAELERRGHPLFNRVTVQVVDRTIIKENLISINQGYHMLKQTKGLYPRNRGRMCDYCQYNELCKLDYHQPADVDRQILINRFIK